MRQEYTWNHVLLLAKICGCRDREEHATASWVNITEEHNRRTFPFTLWPLSYRTCDVTTSPAMCSPVYVTSDKPGPEYVVKLIKCNEVVIVCFQYDPDPLGSQCEHPSVAESDGSESEDLEDSSDADVDYNNHQDTHSDRETSALLPCYISRLYNHMKLRLKDEFYDMQEGVQTIICTGYGGGAALASCFASDMSRVYDKERDFLALDAKTVDVDFVGFHEPVVASPAYWEELCSGIDDYISVSFEGLSMSKQNLFATTGNNKVVACINPRTLVVKLSAPEPLKSQSPFQSMVVALKKRGRGTPTEPGRNVSDYIAALEKKMSLSVERIQ